MRRLLIGTVLGAALATTAACGSSGAGEGSGGSGTNHQKASIKIGLLTDVTGAAASAHADDKIGAQAYINYVNAHGGVNGQKIDMVLADTTSTQAGALSAAQKLVQHDDVFAIIEDSNFFTGAEGFLLKEGVPVVGSAIDGPIWVDPKNTNLFAAEGVHNQDYMNLADGKYMKARGVTSCAAIGFSGSEGAAKAATGFTKSCAAAGLKVGYLNTQIPIGSTDVGAVALAIKNSGADGLQTAVLPSTSFALINRLRELGVHLKSAMMLTGYGSDLLESQANIAAAQQVEFSTFGYPAEVHNPATDLRRANLAKLGAKSPPTGGAQMGYLIAVAFTAGLRAAGPSPSRETFISKMRAIKDFTGDGLLPNKVNFGDYAPATTCLTVVKLVGKRFVPMKPMPLCAGTKKVF